jgi:Common central domain of tyrosinase
MLLVSLLASIVFAACDNIETRLEWRQLSSQQQEAYLAAVTQLYNKPNTSEDPEDWNSSQYGQYHFDTYNENHSVRNQTFRPTLLPWHRVFIHRYEAALKKINPDVILPYWDWTIGHETPLDNSIMQAFGRQVDAGTNCLSSGVAAGWNDHLGNCLRRISTSSPFWSARSVVDIVERNRDYRNFQDALEFGPHPVVHMTVGGQGGQFSSSLSANGNSPT